MGEKRSIRTILRCLHGSLVLADGSEESRRLPTRSMEDGLCHDWHSLKRDCYAMQTLRDYLWRCGESVHRLDDDQVFDRICYLLTIGRLHLGALPAAERMTHRRGATAQPAAAAVPPPSPKRQPDERPRERTKPEEKKTWIEIELVDEQGAPLPEERYRIRLSDGSIREGTLDANGRARFDRIDAGTCDLAFLSLATRTAVKP